MNRALLILGALVGALASGCFSVQRSAPKPALTYVGSKPVTLSADLVGNVLVVETKWDKFGPYHFLVDTGSSVTLVSPELALRYAAKDQSTLDEPRVRVRSPGGGSALLDAVTLKRLQLGSARFEYVPALVYDCTDLSGQFGMKIDGILGFPLFRQTVLTLDYPHARIVLRNKIPEDGLPGEAILFTNRDKTPLIPIRLGDHEFAALIDSGSSEAIDINPAGLAPRFSFGPVDGPTVSTLAGDRPSRLGRLDGVVRMGSFDITNPVAEVTDELSSLGGGVLSHFTVTFDQEHNEAFFQRDSTEPLAIPSLRGSGMSFRKTPAYWKVVSVLPGSPAAGGGVTAGDLVSRINGEPVASWDPQRYDRLVATATEVQYAFIDGTSETSKPLAVVNIVP
jgi:hypothetical protein